MISEHETTARTAGVKTEQSPRDERAATPGRPTVDEMSEWSFPASDPPATWNWEPRARVADTNPGHDGTGASR